MLQVDGPDSGSARPTRMPADRGWSLDLTASGRLGATLSAFLLVSLLAPTASLAAGYDPSSDVNSMANTADYTGATAWWDAGYTGNGVDVALIDTGVAPVDGLDGDNKIVYGPDLSLESQAPELRNLDTNGHGTFMAGIIAGKSSGYKGMAPDARIVSVKVGVADGGTDVSQVIAAIDWVVQHRHDGDLDILVINLSYGTNSAQDAKVDPLAFAAERAWKEGIVVVVAGGNYGFQNHMSNAPALADPAIDRYVLAVGSSDSAGTMTQADDKVPAFSPWPKRGATRGVDMIAPGAHIQGLRVPDSYLDQTYPEGQLGSRFFRGSGTSESAAMVSGAAALILQ
jgi:serine protease AprX